jgi:uncharacterized protein YjcR
MRILEKHRKIAKLLWNGDLTVEKIAEQFKVSDDTIYYWQRQPEFQKLLFDIDDEHRQKAKRQAVKWAERSMKTLVKLQEYTEPKFDEAGKEIVAGGFPHDPETARKAAVNVLESAEVTPKDEDSKGSKNIIIIRDGNGNKA